ncbi:MAG: hypothetical protein H0T74_06360 [Rubrobacteraceae bacterium]|nr:hypothetical protein [Rubrobacteraceae bacterium]
MRVFRVFVICMMAAMLASCGGQEMAAPEQPEKKDVDEAAGENTSVMETTAEETSMEETTGYDTSYTEEEQAKADAAKAAAAKEDITLEQLGSIDASTSYGEQLVLGLGSCQLIKFRTAVGKKAYNEWQDEFVDEAAESTGPVTSMQEEMIVMGYSCTVPEAMAGMPEEE